MKEGTQTKVKGIDWKINKELFCANSTSLHFYYSVGRPCCVPCYELKFTHECRLCGKKIGLDSRDISYNDTHWHEKCYTCQV